MSKEKIIIESIKILEQGDKDFYLRLQALAKMKIEEPAKYKLAISLLKI